MTIEWGEPPPAPYRGAQIHDELDELRQHPNEWACIHVGGRGGNQALDKLVGRLVDGTHPACREGDRFEAVRRTVEKVENGYRYGVWARFVSESNVTPLRDPKPKGQPQPHEAKGYICDHCDEELPTPAALKHHVNRRHPEQVA